MKVTETVLSGVFLIEPDIFGDERGYFFESYSKQKLADFGITADFVQDNQSFSKEKGTLRGLHYQRDPMAQAKLLRVTKGAIFDVAVDVRKGSPTYGKWVSAVLTSENHHQFYIPRGFLHGFITIEDNTEVQYKADNFYSPQDEGSVLWSDPALAIDWPIAPTVLSGKDAAAPVLSEATKINFVY